MRDFNYNRFRNELKVDIQFVRNKFIKKAIVITGLMILYSCVFLPIVILADDDETDKAYFYSEILNMFYSISLGVMFISYALSHMQEMRTKEGRINVLTRPSIVFLLFRRQHSLYTIVLLRYKTRTSRYSDNSIRCNHPTLSSILSVHEQQSTAVPRSESTYLHNCVYCHNSSDSAPYISKNRNLLRHNIYAEIRNNYRQDNNSDAHVRSCRDWIHNLPMA